MKIGYASDCHLEFGDLELYNTKNADVLILAGDIIVESELFAKGERHYLNGREFAVSLSDRFHQFFQQVCEEFKEVIYILGNHEHYHGDFADTYNHLKEVFSYLPNLHILEKEKIVINGVTFLCGTMWTDFNNNDDYSMYLIENRMNDFQIIRNSNQVVLKEDSSSEFQRVRTGIFSARDAYKEHQYFLEFVKSELSKEENRKVIMVTHQCPSSICIPDKYKGDTTMNPGYISNLEDFILDNPKIKVWICGHSHRVLEGMIGPTEILMNCRGYDGYEPMADDFELKYFEV